MQNKTIMIIGAVESGQRAAKTFYRLSHNKVNLSLKIARKKFVYQIMRYCVDKG